MVYLDDISALRVWEAHAAGWPLRPTPCPTLPTSLARPSASELRSVHAAMKSTVGERLHVMVDHAERRSSLDKIEFSALDPSSPMPSGSFCDAQLNVRVPCPELCFVRLARTMTREELAMTGMMLCGTYAIDPESGKTEYDAQPLTTVSRLRDYIERMPHSSGRRVAQEVARHLADGSASPRESALYLSLTLPTMLGGFQLPKPTLNSPVHLDEDAQRISGQSFAVCDLLWEDRGCAVEYDSDMMHEGRRKQDIERRNALESMGIWVLNITTGIFDDFDRLCSCVRALRRRLGLRPAKEEPATMARRRELHQTLRLFRPF